MKNKKRWLGVLLALSLAAAGCGKKQEESLSPEKETAVSDDARWQEAQETPYGKYPETVSYTLGQMSGANNSNLPEGDTYENNAYTRYLRKMLNVQNETIYSESEERYGEMVDILVKDRTLPDILVLSDRETLKEMVRNDLVEDLTEVYEKCTTPRIKEMYESYGGELLKSVEFDGRMMAVPETVIDHGPRFLWLRRDWMDKLGLQEPRSLEEAFSVIEEFQRNRMGAGNGEEPVGLVCDTSLVGTTSSNYSVDPVFEAFGARPQRWQQDKNGNVVYGSLTRETRDALEYLNSLYERGIIDKNFVLRTRNNLRDLVLEGKCGAFFGLWWSPNNPLMDMFDTDQEADWEPYYFPPEKESTAYASFRDNKYVVVRRGYEHPEVVMKVLSVLFDYTRYEAEDAQEVNNYFALNVDPTARPFVINVDYNEATYKVTKNIRRVLEDDMAEPELSAIEKSYYDACRNYLRGEKVTAEDWAAYKSRIAAVGLLVDADYTPPKRMYLEDYDTEIPKNLKNLEQNVFIQIIMGRQEIEYFDEFVEEWKEQSRKKQSQEEKIDYN